jgi:PAS domain S-box-containing protein
VTTKTTASEVAETSLSVAGPEPASLPRTAPTILVVDDETGFADTLADILGSRGYRTVKAGNGREATHLVQQVHIDLALVDLKLPDISGTEVLARIRDTSPGTEVIILTGHASLDTALRALNLGASGYLEKPYDIDRLFLTIERTLASRARRTATSPATELGRLLDASPVPVFSFETATGIITAASAAFDRLFQDSVDDERFGPRPTLRQIFAHADPDEVTAHLARLERFGRAGTDLPLRGREGTAAWFEFVSHTIDTKPGLALGVLVDITARRQAEAESRRGRQYFEAVFDNLAAGVALIDSSYTIERVNAAFARFYRKTAAELVGRKCYEVIHSNRTPCQLHGDVCPMYNCLALGITTRVQHRHVDAEGKVRYQETTMTPLRDEEGTVVSFAAVYADFTEIKLAQEESEAKSKELEQLNQELAAQSSQLTAQAEELEKANTELVRLTAAKDDFVSMVSHELRTPLTAISEGINLVADGSLGQVSEQQRRFLGLAHRNCIRLTELINDLLDLSKIEAGRMDVRPVRFDLAHMLQELVETFAVSAREKRLAISASGSDQPHCVYADERMTRRVLNNLLSNALKFTDSGEVRIRIEAKTDHVLVSIADSGIGIPASEQKRMFEKFHQVQRADRGRPAGTGLGLALTKEMVEMNGGRIWFESQESVGTTFFFTLPFDSDIARVSVLLSRRTAAAVQPRVRTAMLVALLDGAELRRDRGADALAQAADAIDSLLNSCHLGILTRQHLPESGSVLLLLEGTESELVAQEQALRDKLRGATFVLGGEVARVRVGASSCRLNGVVEPRVLLEALCKEVTDVC